MKLILVLLQLIFISVNLCFIRAEKVNSENENNNAHKYNKGDLDTASTFGIGHGFGYRRKHHGHHSHWLGYNDHHRPTFGRIIITYPKYIGYGHVDHEYGHGHDLGHHNSGYGHGHGHGHKYSNFKKARFYPSRYLGPISNYGHGYHNNRIIGHGWHGYFG